MLTAEHNTITNMIRNITPLIGLCVTRSTGCPRYVSCLFTFCTIVIIIQHWVLGRGWAITSVAQLPVSLYHISHTVQYENATCANINTFYIYRLLSYSLLFSALPVFFHYWRMLGTDITQCTLTAVRQLHCRCLAVDIMCIVSSFTLIYSSPYFDFLNMFLVFVLKFVA